MQQAEQSGCKATHHSHVCAWVEQSAALFDNYVARDAVLPAIQLHAHVLGQRLASKVAR